MAGVPTLAVKQAGRQVGRSVLNTPELYQVQRPDDEDRGQQAETVRTLRVHAFY